MEQNEKSTQMLFYLVGSFEIAAMQGMGKISNPVTNKTERNLEQAQFAIDVLDMIKEKMNGNLTEYESKYIDNTASQLKLNYLDELEKSKKETGTA